MTYVNRGAQPLILVVDDEALLRMVAADLFADAGYEVLEAASGPEALGVLESRPDVRAVVTDVQMPGDPDGLGLARRFRERCPDCAIVVVSGRVLPGSEELAANAAFLQKPYGSQEIVNVVERLLLAG